MRILFLSGYSPLDVYMGTGEYNQRLLGYLAQQGAEIHYVCFTELIDRRKTVLRATEIPHFLRSLRIAGWRRCGDLFFDPHWKRWLLTPLRLLSETADRRLVAGIARLLGRRKTGSAADGEIGSGRRRIDATRRALIAEACAAVRPDVVMVDGTYFNDCFDAVPVTCAALKVVVTIDVYHRRAASLQALGATTIGNYLGWEEEIELLAKADVIVALQEEEAAILAEMVPTRPVVTAPLAPAVLPEWGEGEVNGRCLFIGSRCDHNEVSLAWFLEAVWPLVRARCPEATLHVCGRICDGYAGRKFSGVVFRGLVADLGREYAAAQVSLVPLRAGSGLKIKTVQAIAQSKPAVVTSFGAQGLRHLDGRAFLIADEPVDYATATASLLTNSAQREHLRAGAVEAFKKFFSPEVCYGPLIDALRQPLASHAPAAPY